MPSASCGPFWTESCTPWGRSPRTELLPQSFAYKILKKLDRAGLIEVVRGDGGRLPAGGGPVPAPASMI